MCAPKVEEARPWAACPAAYANSACALELDPHPALGQFAGAKVDLEHAETDDSGNARPHICNDQILAPQTAQGTSAAGFRMP